MGTTEKISGKIALITGSTSGIGKETARHLLRAGYFVLLTGRNEDKGLEARNELRQDSGRDAVEFLQVDLTHLPSLQGMVEKVEKDFGELNLLVNNAGGIFKERIESGEGVEMTLALNSLAAFRTSRLFLPSILRQNGRIINLSTFLHGLTRIRWADLQYHDLYESFSAYYQSKLLNLLWTFQAAEMLSGSRVSIHAADPGIASTGGFDEVHTGSEIRKAAISLLPNYQSKEAAGYAVFVAATDPRFSLKSGLHIGPDGRICLPSPQSNSKAERRKANRILSELAGLPENWI